MAQCHEKLWGAFLPRVCKGLVVVSLSKDAEEALGGMATAVVTYYHDADRPKSIMIINHFFPGITLAFQIAACVIAQSSKRQSPEEVMDWFLSRCTSPELRWVHWFALCGDSGINLNHKENVF
ncbi:hypothetical protein AV530_005685 [Patagioenas fasciata monilis]|uniref:Uncharacterized protein n=1 Tax=Patagioenas fasciata monilis TaxID=372326 RepID=A0A1V4JM90_PATFA|nr:hypothetical protein AV530_005685 [Patagioenas fasciata monilis]